MNVHAILYESDVAKKVGFVAFIGLFVGEVALIATHPASVLALSAWQLAALGLAAFRGGVSLAEDGVFSWLREIWAHPEPDSKAAGDSIVCNYEHGLMGTIAACFECPECASTHVGSVLLALIALVPDFGLSLTYALAAASIAEQIHALRERNSWTGRHEREMCRRD